MSLETTTTAKIRFIDCDPIGHLNNSKYLDYMLNAREDHVEDYYGFTYQEIIKQTGCTWVTVQNEIAYLREVRYNDIVERRMHMSLANCIHLNISLFRCDCFFCHIKLIIL